MTGARLSLAARFLWAARPLLVLGFALAVLLGPGLALCGANLAAVMVGQAAVLLLAEVGHRLTVPVVVHRELVAQARQVSPPM